MGGDPKDKWIFYKKLWEVYYWFGFGWVTYLMYLCSIDSLPYLNLHFPTTCICTCVCTSHHSKSEPLSTSSFPTSIDFDLWYSIPSHFPTWNCRPLFSLSIFVSLLSLSCLLPATVLPCWTTSQPKITGWSFWKYQSDLVLLVQTYA